MQETIAIGADHGGFELKEIIIKHLRLSNEQEVIDLGCYREDKPVDYPDYAWAVGEAILQGKAQVGIVICGSGVGACIAANKIPGIRAGLCHDSYSAHQGREHDDVNVLCLGARVIGYELALDLVKTFLGARFSGEERHQSRLDKVKQIEQQTLKVTQTHHESG